MLFKLGEDFTLAGLAALAAGVGSLLSGLGAYRLAMRKKNGGDEARSPDR